MEHFDDTTNAPTILDKTKDFVIEHKEAYIAAGLTAVLYGAFDYYSRRKTAKASLILGQKALIEHYNGLAAYAAKIAILTVGTPMAESAGKQVDAWDKIRAEMAVKADKGELTPADIVTIVATGLDIKPAA